MKGAVYSSIIILLQTEGCKVTFFYDYDELFRQTDLWIVDASLDNRDIYLKITLSL
jgi:hypothetical protein